VPRGGTEMAAGMRAGLEELLHGRNRVGRAISSLLLLTDGRTYGDESRCLDLAEVARRHELLITPLGVGDEWNEDLLEAIAFRCGSHSVYIDRAEAIVDAFRQHILELRSICGRQATLTLRTNPGTRLAQIHRITPLIGRIELLPSPNVSEQTYALGNLLLGDPQTLLLEIVLPAIGEGEVEMVHCTLEWQPTDSLQPAEQAEYTITAPVNRFARPAQALDEQVKVAVEKVVAYKLQKRAWQDLQEGNLAQATTKLRMVATRLLAAGEPELARTVQAEADHLERHGFASVVGTKQIKYGTRGLGRTRSIRAAEQARSS
jgi:Ca-activated chloride channel homolog